MVLELSDHFVSLFCFDVVFDFGGEVEIIFGAVGSEKHSCDAKKLELEVEQMTLLLDDQDVESREAIMAPPRFQCLNAVRPVLNRGLGLRAEFSTSRTTRAGLSSFSRPQQL